MADGLDKALREGHVGEAGVMEWGGGRGRRVGWVRQEGGVGEAGGHRLEMQQIIY